MPVGHSTAACHDGKNLIFSGRQMLCDVIIVSRVLIPERFTSHDPQNTLVFIQLSTVQGQRCLHTRDILAAAMCRRVICKSAAVNELSSLRIIKLV